MFSDLKLVLQGQHTSRKKLLDSNKQLRASKATLTATVKSLEEQLAAVQALLHANQTGRASSSPPTPHTPALQVNLC